MRREVRMSNPDAVSIDSVIKAKPAGAKGTYLKKISISSTMGPGIKIALGSVGVSG